MPLRPTPSCRLLLAGLGLTALAVTGLPSAALAATSPGDSAPAATAAGSAAVSPSSAPWTTGAARSRTAVPPRAVLGSELLRGQALAPGDALRSAGGRYSLVNEANGDLVLLKNPNQLSAQPYGLALFFGGRDGSLVLQDDGNLVLYTAAGKVAFTSGTAGSTAERLVVQDDGNVVLYGRGGSVLFQTATASPAFLLPGGTLLPGETLTSSDRGTVLVMQPDGNLVLYTRGTVRFATATFVPGSAAVLQEDGNFVVYTPQGRPVFATGTSSEPGAGQVEVTDGEVRVATVVGEFGTIAWGSAWATGVVEPGMSLFPGDRRSAPGGVELVMQTDGNLVEYVRGRPVFQSGTSGLFVAATMQPDGNFVVYQYDLESEAAAAVFSTRSAGHPGSRLVVQGDGNVVVYTPSGQPVFSAR